MTEATHEFIKTISLQSALVGVLVPGEQSKEWLEELCEYWFSRKEKSTKTAET